MALAALLKHPAPWDSGESAPALHSVEVHPAAATAAAAEQAPVAAAQQQKHQQQTQAGRTSVLESPLTQAADPYFHAVDNRLPQGKMHDSVSTTSGISQWPKVASGANCMYCRQTLTRVILRKLAWPLQGSKLLMAVCECRKHRNWWHSRTITSAPGHEELSLPIPHIPSGHFHLEGQDCRVTGSLAAPQAVSSPLCMRLSAASGRA